MGYGMPAGNPYADAQYVPESCRGVLLASKGQIDAIRNAIAHPQAAGESLRTLYSMNRDMR